MANLIPLSKSEVVKYQKTGVLNTSKFFGSDKKTKVNDVNTKKEPPKLLESTLSKIERKVIQIDKLLKDSLALRKKQTKVSSKEKEDKTFAEREKELEKNKPKPVKGVKLPTVAPKLGLFDWIKNFIFNTILGYFAVKYFDQLPKLLKLIPTILKVGESIIDFAGSMLDGLVTFVDWGYKAIDGTRGFMKDIGGEGLAKNFDKFAGAIDNVLEIAIIAALATADSGGGFGGGPKPGGGRPGRGGGPGGGNAGGFRQKGDKWQGFTYDRILREKGIDQTLKQSDNAIMKRYFQKYGRDAFVQRFGEEGLKRLPGGMQRGLLQKGARSAFVNLAGKGGAKAILKFTRPLLKRLPIIGALIDFGLSVALGEPLGRAAFKAIGAGLLGAVGAAIGSVVPIAGNIVGGLLGGMAGDAIGGALYDMFFGGKKPQQPKGKVVKAAGGGKPATRGGKLVGGPSKRTIKKKKTPRTLRVTPTKLRPGAAIGGEKQIKKLYPESKDKTKMSPFDFLKNSYENFSKSSGLETLISFAIKPLMGDKLSYADYKNAGVGINNWMNQTVSSGTLAYAGGGEVKMESIASGEDYSDVIAKSLQDSVAPQVDKTIQDLMKQLMLKQPTKEPDKSDPTLEGDDEGGGGGMTEGTWGPLLDLIAGKESGGNYEAMYPSTTLKGATKMTIAEVARRATGAVGKYQQLPQYLVGRAKSAGLNPDKDLYSPENQEKIIINVNIKGRGGEKWLKGEISDEEFMQGLSQEFASLPNAQGEFYYPGQKSSMTAAKVKAALSKVKKGGYTQEELAMGRDVNLKGGSGKFVQGNSGNSGGIHFHIGPGSQPGQVDTKYNADAREAASKVVKHFLGKKSLYDGRRGASYTSGNAAEILAAQRAHSASGSQGGIDIQVGGAYDPGAKVAFPFAVSNMAYRPGGFGVSAKISGLNAFVAHGRYDEKGKIAKQERGVNLYAFHGKVGIVPKDGFILKLHKGEMYKIVDKDSVDLLGIDLARDVIEIENKAQLVARAPSIIQKLKAISGYTDYEQPEIQYVEVPVPIEIPIEVPIPMGSGGGGGGGVNSNNTFDRLAIG